MKSRDLEQVRTLIREELARAAVEDGWELLATVVPGDMSPGATCANLAYLHDYYTARVTACPIANAVG